MTLIRVSLPESIAADLGDDFAPVHAEAHRDSNWEIALSAASDAAVVVTLLQTPETVAKVAAACLALVKRGATSSSNIDATGPGGQLRLKVTDETDLSSLTDFLEKTIFLNPRDDKPEH